MDQQDQWKVILEGEQKEDKSHHNSERSNNKQHWDLLVWSEQH